MNHTSVTVTLDAQNRYLAQNPTVRDDIMKKREAYQRRVAEARGKRGLDVDNNQAESSTSAKKVKMGP